jgi:hypothetical protein
MAEEERHGGQRRPAPAPDPRGDQADARGDHDHQRLEDEAELRDAEVELGLEGRQPEQEAAGQRDRERDPRQARAVRAGRAAALDGEDGDADERHRRAADQHEVRRAPQRHVLAEEPVPHVVEREAEQRERAAGADEHAAQRRVPVRAEPDRRGARALLRAGPSPGSRR